MLNLSFFHGQSQQALASPPAGLESLLVDADMEASGVTAWTATNSALLTKQGDAYAGSQCLRITRNGSSNFPGAGQAVLAKNTEYRFHGWYRHDGTTNQELIIYCGDNLKFWSNYWETGWLEFDFTHTTGNNANDVNIDFVSYGGNSGGYTEIDHIVIEAT